MSTPHKATAEQWSQIEVYAATDLNDDYAKCLLDLHTRVEALEEALLALVSTVSSAGNDHKKRIEALEQLHQAVVDLNERFTLGPLVDRVEALEAAQREHARHLRLDCSIPPVSEAENDRRFEACKAAIDAATPEQIRAVTQPATPAPASSLVQRVAEAIAHKGCFAPDEIYGEEARDAIREVAAWLVEQAPEPGPVGRWLGHISTPFAVMADMLREEANRGIRRYPPSINGSDPCPS
jgi:hypothetical protein